MDDIHRSRIQHASLILNFKTHLTCFYFLLRRFKLLIDILVRLE